MLAVRGRARRPAPGPRAWAACRRLIERCRRNLAAVEAWVEGAGWAALPRRTTRDPLAHLGLPHHHRPRLHRPAREGASGLRQGPDPAPGRGAGGLRHRQLPRRPGGPAPLVRCHGRDRRRRGPAAVARLGLRHHPGPARLTLSPSTDTCHAKSAHRRRAEPRCRCASSPSAGVEAEVRTGLTKDELLAIIGDYDGLAVRSATKVTADVLAAATRLKVVGRAGIGVDNIDVDAATQRGVVVMNTPFGNSVTTAEHAISLMLALCRQIPPADRSTRAGKWEKSRFMGVELMGKTLGLIGCGNIGSIVADRAQGLKMRVDRLRPLPRPGPCPRPQRREGRARRAPGPRRPHHPPHPADRAHPQHPLPHQPRAHHGPACASSTAPAAAWSTSRRCTTSIKAGHIAGAALDVFATEPARESPLFALDEVIVTPHLGAVDQRGAGERGPPGGRADQRLPDHGCGRERAQHAGGHRRGGTPHPPLHAPGRAAGLLRGPAHRDRRSRPSPSPMPATPPRSTPGP